MLILNGGFRARMLRCGRRWETFCSAMPITAITPSNSPLLAAAIGSRIAYVASLAPNGLFVPFFIAGHNTHVQRSTSPNDRIREQSR